MKYKNRFASLIFMALIASFSIPSYASRLLEIGSSSSATLDKTYIDLDSIHQEDNFKVATFLTVYEAARINKNGIKLDRHTLNTAFDCPNKKFSLLQTTGFLEGKQIGSSPLSSDWKSNLKDVPSNPYSQRAFSLVCGINHAGLQPNTPQPVLPQQPKFSSDTGIALDSDGYILTDNHVVSACKTITVQVVNDQRRSAVIEVADPKNDLALLKTPMHFKQVAKFRASSQPIKLSEEIGVIGFPLTGILFSEPKATFGQINSVAGVQSDFSRFQISVPLQPGNSGGPVLDEHGAVVGIVVSQASLALAAIIGNIPQNINFAIHGELAQMFMTAHGINYSEGHHAKKLETDEIAEIGKKISVSVLCDHE